MSHAGGLICYDAVQIAYATVTLAGYTAYFAPELLLGRSPMISDQKAAWANAASASKPRDVCGVDEQADLNQTCRSESPDQQPAAHSRASRRPSAAKPARDMPGSVQSSEDICPTDAADSRQANDSRSGAYLSPQVLWLCGSFTVQVITEINIVRAQCQCLTCSKACAPPTLNHTNTLAQAAEKLVLAEGSKMVMAVAQSAYDQGVYGLVANLGSLVVRTLFQPVEEAAFTAFSKSGGAAQLSYT